MRIATLLLALGLAGCGGLASPSEGGLVSGEGPPYVAEARFEIRVRHTDLVPVHVFFLADPDGHPLRGELKRALVMVQGGGISTADYEWLAVGLARRGLVVALPEHPAELAIFAIENGEGARALLAAPPRGSLLEGFVDPEKIGVAGHSLGGVVATKLAREGRFQALALLAAFPDDGDGEWLPSMPSLSLSGRDDCEAKLANVEKGAATLPAPSALVVLDGATHYQFTDDDTRDVKAGCVPSTPIDVTHARMLDALDVFLHAALDRGETDAERLSTIEGAEVLAR